ncbi:NB-ARC domain-containing protein [Actinoplanes teichomyceticus]|uniref:WD-40 repeat-containing protein n=1 Tax=Actinoplanes teichomyceticus TaxID=1867 RepID=A0A561WIH4_ACTTI|nr:NB-ARC domain-containing protein [Actinoplanes teichomyceticus]TWG23610.1 WD-40 repeat-containing protein [Actinoplanes teichomyceticus]GIF11649.1 hypothetical protein Ate01nite_16810 [Actinoplanes teichomyceticus]
MVTDPAGAAPRDSADTSFVAQTRGHQYNAPGGSVVVNNYGAGRGARVAVPWMLPELGGRRPIDRPDLTRRMLDFLSDGSGATIGVTTALHGAGGFGKTTLASYVCSRPELRRLFPGGLLWLTVGQEKSGPELASMINDLCVHLTGERPSFTDPMQVGYYLGSLLDEREPTLLVVDDVWTEDQLRPLLIGGERCTRLVTTRVPAVIGDDARFIRVDQMEQQESAALLDAGLHGVSHGQRRRLLELTGRWPLLLALVNGALRRTVRDGGDMRDAAQDMIDRLSQYGPASLDVRVVDRRDRAVDTTVQASMALLGDRDRERYQELAIFAEDVDIPFEMVARLWRATGGYADGDVIRVMDDLADLSLLAAYRRNPRSLRLHDVLRQYLRHLCGADLLARLNDTFLAANLSALGAAADPPSWWALPADQDYLWRNVPYHIAESGRTGQLENLLTDLRWVAEKSWRYDMAAVEADLSRADSPTIVNLKAALARESHVLRRITPKDSYPGVIMSRLEKTAAISAVVDRYRRNLDPPAERIENFWPLPDQSAALVRVFTENANPMHGCLFSPDAAQVITVGGGGSVTVWSRETGQRLFDLAGHTDTVTGCALSPDGLTLVTSSADGTVRVWDLLSRKPRTLLTGHDGAVNGCALTADGSTLLTFGDDGSARTWDTTTWEQRVVFGRHGCRVLAGALSPDGSWALTASSDGRVRKWCTGTGEQHDAVSAHIGRATACDIAPDGTWFATGGDDTVIRIWDAATMRYRHDLTGHRARVGAVAICGTGKLLASAGDDQTVRVHETSYWSTRTILRGHSWYVTACRFSADGQWLLSSGWDRSARLWRADQTVEDVVEPAARRRTTACAASARSGDPATPRLVTGGRDGEINVWQLSENTHAVLGRCGGTVRGVDVAADGTLAVSCSTDGAVRVWDVATGAEHLLEDPGGTQFERCRISPDKRLVAAASQDGTISVWSWPARRLEHILARHDGWAADCSFSPDGRLLASTGWDRTVRLWNLASGRQEVLLNGHDCAVYCCAFSAGGTELITGGDDGKVRVWSTTSGTRLAVLEAHEGAVRACAVSRDRNLILTGGDDGSVRLWHKQGYRNVASMRISSPVSDVCWADIAGERCLSVVGDAGVHLFRVREAPGPRVGVRRP